jgi:hypothetical protein
MLSMTTMKAGQPERQLQRTVHRNPPQGSAVELDGEEKRQQNGRWSWIRPCVVLNRVDILTSLLKKDTVVATSKNLGCCNCESCLKLVWDGLAR